MKGRGRRVLELRHPDRNVLNVQSFLREFAQRARPAVSSPYCLHEHSTSLSHQ